MNPGESARADRRLAPARDERRRRERRPAAPSPAPATTSTRRHQRRRVEEMQPEDARRAGRRGRDRRDREGARVRREDRRRARPRRRASGRSSASASSVLEGGLDRRVGLVAERSRTSARPQPGEPPGDPVVDRRRDPAPPSRHAGRGRRAIRSRPRSSAASSTSWRTTSWPASSATWAMPAPIDPGTDDPDDRGARDGDLRSARRQTGHGAEGRSSRRPMSPGGSAAAASADRARFRIVDRRDDRGGPERTRSAAAQPRRAVAPTGQPVSVGGSVVPWGGVAVHRRRRRPGVPSPGPRRRSAGSGVGVRPRRELDCHRSRAGRCWGARRCRRSAARRGTGSAGCHRRGLAVLGAPAAVDPEDLHLVVLVGVEVAVPEQLVVAVGERVDALRRGRDPRRRRRCRRSRSGRPCPCRRGAHSWISQVPGLLGIGEEEMEVECADVGLVPDLARPFSPGPSWILTVPLLPGVSLAKAEGAIPANDARRIAARRPNGRIKEAAGRRCMVHSVVEGVQPTVLGAPSRSRPTPADARGGSARTCHSGGTIEAA